MNNRRRVVIIRSGIMGFRKITKEAALRISEEYGFPVEKSGDGEFEVVAYISEYLHGEMDSGNYVSLEDIQKDCEE